MNKLASIFRPFAALCAILFAATLCHAREITRGIVAEKIGGTQDKEECSEPEIRFQLGHSGNVESVAWSPDGKYIATGSYDGTVRVWEAASGKEVQKFQGYANVLSVAWAPDGKRIAFGDIGGTVGIYELLKGKEMQILLEYANPVESVVWSPDGKYVVGGSWDSTLRIWEVDTGKEVRRLSGHTDVVNSVAWSPDGRYIASGSKDSTLRIWEADTGKEMRKLSGHTSAVESVAWSPDNKFIVSAQDKTLMMWDVTSEKLVREFLGHSEIISSVAWAPDGDFIASGSLDDSLRLWDATSGKEVWEFSATTMNSITWSPDGMYIAGCFFAVNICEVASGKTIQSFAEESSWVNSLAWSLDGSHIASGDNDGSIKIWNTSNGQNEKRIFARSSSVSSVAWSPDGKHIASENTWDNVLRIWDVSSTMELQALSGHSDDDWVMSVVWSPNGKYIATGGTETVRFWDARSGEEIRVVFGNFGYGPSLAWSSDGTYIARGGKNGIIKIWDAVSGKEVQKLSVDFGSVWSMAYSPDGQYISSVSGNRDNTVRILSVVSGNEVQTLPGHSDVVMSVAWSPDGKRIVSGSYDTTVRIWDVANGNEVRTLLGHSSPVRSVAWSPDGKRIASGSNDGTIKIWDAQSGALLSTIINGKGSEWLTYTPEGFFCGSEWATQNLAYIVDGMEVIGIDQAYDMLYRPDLVAAKIRGEDISPYVVSLSSLVRSGRAPAVSISGVPAESFERDMTLTVSVRNMGGGIGAVNLLLNGKSIRISDGVSLTDGETVSFRHTVTLQNGSNTLEAFALNEAGLVESVRSSMQVAWKGATEKPDLYVLTVAVNRYFDSSLWLNYAVPDAEAVALAFQNQKSGLYKNVYVSGLRDADVTKEKLTAEFSRLAEQVRADDVFVFYISGHGTTNDDGDYYYLPYDFRYTSKDSISNGCISKNDLTKYLSGIKAGKTLVMLDTCNSGAYLSDTGKRGLSEKTAIDRLTRATGHATLAASSDEQFAMEGYGGHGVFTYVFLEGIAGAADSDSDGYVTLNELSAFVEQEVPERSYEKWGYRQIPQKNLQRQDFPIVRK